MKTRISQIENAAMFDRKIIKSLKTWKEKSNRKPLILRGARQIGKTTAVNIFAREFENYVYLNLERENDKSLFDKKYAVNDIFQAVLLSKNMTLVSGDILLFIDEIQNSPTAIKMLRYFYEELPHLYVIAAGSLLEVVLEKENLSFPVGRVEYLYMYPVAFDEFLQAQGATQLLEMLNTIPAPEISLAPLLTNFHRYAALGGMPEIVKNYLQDQTLANLASTYESLIRSYMDDVDRYAKNASMRQIMKHCIESIPHEAGERIKFQGFGASNYRTREIGEALRTLERAMLIYLIYPTTAVQLPLPVNKKKSPKLQFLDTGLINYFVGLQPQYFKQDDLLAIYKGMIAEHIVRQEINAIESFHNHAPLFWVRESNASSAEIDIIRLHDGLPIPVEVKAGATGRLRSLHQFMNRADHPYAVRLYQGPLEINKLQTGEGKKFNLLNLPYCLAGKIDEYIAWFINTI